MLVKKVFNGKKLESGEFTYGLQEYKDSEYSTKVGHEKEVTNDQREIFKLIFLMMKKI